MSDVVKNKLLYADDSGKNIAHVEKLLTESLGLVNQWRIDNKLSLHLGNTESILLGSKYKIKSSY